MKIQLFVGWLISSAFLLCSGYTGAAATHTLTIQTNGAGIVNRNPTNSVYPQGAVVTLTAIASNGWMFVSWSGDATGSANPINVTMDTNKVITANFSTLPLYTLTVLVSGQGSVNPNGGTFQSNTVVSLTASPTSGWIFNGWSGDASGSANPVSVTMNSDRTVTASFVQPPLIASQPNDAFVGVGGTATFSVGAGGTPPLSYAWRFNGSALAGANAANLTITNAQVTHAGNYSLVVTNAYGSTTSRVATLTVTNVCVGSNVVTVCDETGLRAAVARGGTVQFCCNGTIALTNTIAITRNVALDGGPYAVTISGSSGSNAVRLFRVATNVTFELKNLILANGRHAGTNGANAGEDGLGGAIYNAGGTVRVISCVLSNNSAVGGNSPSAGGAGGAGKGGAIFNDRGSILLNGVLAISNSVAGGFAENFSGTNGHGLGGAIVSRGGSVVITGSVFRGNQATGRFYSYVTSGSVAGNARGGALAAEETSLVLQDSKFTSNTAITEPTPEFPGRPGSAYGGALFITSRTAIVSRCEFVGNNAAGGNGSRGSGTGEAIGGAIYNLASLTISDTAFSTNGALAGNYSRVTESGRGGGLFNGGTAYVTRTTFDRNLARGGQVTVGLGNNTAGHAHGGAIFNSGTLSATNCTLTLNRAEAGGAFSLSFTAVGGMAFGGGIQNAGGTVYLMNTTIASNAVVQGESGPAPQGANLANTTGTFTLRNSLVAFGLGFSNNVINGEVYLGVWTSATGPISDGGFNMSSDGSCEFNSGASFNFTDPKLGPLADNGGPTFTMALQPNSPAKDFGTTIGAPSTDQRGSIRPFGPGADIGSYEEGPPPLQLSATRNGSTVELSFYAEAGMTYQLQRSTNLTSWQTYETIGPVAAAGVISRTIPMTGTCTLFRLVK